MKEGRPGLPRNIPRPLPAASQTLQECGKLNVVHFNGLRKVCLQDSAVFAEPVCAGFPLLLLLAVVAENLPVLCLNVLLLNPVKLVPCGPDP